MFLTVMVVGLVGLVMMALPALGGHHLPPSHGQPHGLLSGHAVPSGHAIASGHAAGATTTATAAATLAHPATTLGPVHAHGLLAYLPRAGHGLIPSPRAVFSVLALYGAFGNALVHAAHLTGSHAAFIAIVPALLVERVLMRPVWNLLFRYRAEASSPLEALILSDAHAVVPFRNGRGIVSTVRDGRRVQLGARLCDAHAALPVPVGQRLRIEDVDARLERVTVSVLADDQVATNHRA